MGSTASSDTSTTSSVSTDATGATVSWYRARMLTDEAMKLVSSCVLAIAAKSTRDGSPLTPFRRWTPIASASSFGTYGSCTTMEHWNGFSSSIRRRPMCPRPISPTV